MKYRKFSDVIGETAHQKLTTLLNESSDGRLLVQKKWNGVQFIIDNGRFITRQNKEYNAQLLTPTLRAIGRLTRSDKLIIHGELISHTLSFQDLCGQMSVNRVQQPDWSQITYMVFDGFDGNQNNVPYEERIARISKHVWSYERVAVTSTFPVNSASSANSWYDTLVKQGAEGCIYRIPPCMYDNTSAVHHDIVKRKALKSAEGECISVTEGAGKRKGMLGSMLVFWNGSYLNIGGGKGLTDAYLTKLFVNPPIGKQITFTYEDLSTSGTPLRPQIITVRDYE